MLIFHSSFGTSDLICYLPVYSFNSAGSDYQYSVPYVITFAAGRMEAQIPPVMVLIDNIIELPEAFLATLTLPKTSLDLGITLGVSRNATGAILDMGGTVIIVRIIKGLCPHFQYINIT